MSDRVAGAMSEYFWSKVLFFNGLFLAIREFLNVAELSGFLICKFICNQTLALSEAALPNGGDRF